MVSGTGWRGELERWLAPFLERLGHPARRAMCPLYVAGLIGPGERKSIQPMAERLGLPSHDALHHFIAGGTWDMEPLEAALAHEADRLVGGPDAYLVIDDTALPKIGSRLGRGRSPVRHGARQERQLPDAGLADPRGCYGPLCG